MQVRMSTFVITPDDRRAIRFSKDKRKTMCTRNEAKEWIDAVVQRALRDLRYRWHGPQVDEAVLNGADPAGLASRETPATDASLSPEDVGRDEVSAAPSAATNGNGTAPAAAPEPVTPEPVGAGAQA